MPNDEIKISTVLGDKYVTLNGENIYNNLTIGSKLFYISKQIYLQNSGLN